MCSLPSALDVGLQVAGNYMGQRATAKAAQAQMNQQAQAAFTKMNYAFQDYEIERVDAFDAAVAELDKVSHNAMRVNSGVEAAVNETMSGRTAKMLVRNVEGDTARTKASIKDNFARKSTEIDLNKERSLLSTKDYINNLNASAPKMPSRFSNAISTAGIVLNSYTQTQNQRQAVKNTGAKYNWKTNGAKRNSTIPTISTASKAKKAAEEYYGY
ncbi:hypothetical protein [Phascolarctobacterium faecium]|uniref:virion core protein, T7 gp14 family n=1 Tax=Phascolarctobacterium faecium TaxID=33025 RepID=UPI001032C8FC|nr:hypothetical protein [Phascolarctobacterium faecium]